MTLTSLVLMHLLDDCAERAIGRDNMFCLQCDLGRKLNPLLGAHRPALTEGAHLNCLAKGCFRRKIHPLIAAVAPIACVVFALKRSHDFYSKLTIQKKD
jgi:hypothetical protein